MGKKIKTAAYCSSLPGEDVGSQLILTESYIAATPELEYTDTYVDRGYQNIPYGKHALTKLFKDCNEKRIDCIVVKDLSVFGDVMVWVEPILKNLENWNIRLISIYDLLDTGKKDSVQSKQEQLIKQVLQKDNGEHKTITKGIKLTTAPYGYQVVDNEFIIDPETAETIKEIFNWAAGGVRVADICRELNDRSIPSPMELKGRLGGTWSPRTVDRMIKDESYIGTYVYGKQTKEGRTTPRQNPKDTWYRIENHHEPIVSRELFQKAKEAIGRRGRTQTENVNVDPLNNRMVCGVCGHHLTFLPAKGRVKTEKYFCRNHTGEKPISVPLTKRPEITRDEMMAKVLEACNAYIEKMCKAEKAIDSLNTEENACRVRNLTKKRETYAQELSDLYARHEAELLFQKHREELREKYADLGNELKQAQLRNRMTNMAIFNTKHRCESIGREPLTEVGEKTLQIIREITLNADGTLKIDCFEEGMLDYILERAEGNPQSEIEARISMIMDM